MYENRNFIIFNVSELDKIDFSQVIETSIETVRKSVDGVKTFIKWDEVEPECVSQLTTKDGTYTYSEMIEIITGTEWTHERQRPLV